MSSRVASHEAVENYVHLGPDGTAVPLQVTSAFWEELASGAFSKLGPGRLVSTYDFSENWGSWEKHPAGEELVILLAGELELILSTNGRDERVTLSSPGQFLIVPRDTWHTVNVAQCVRAMFITPGDGTQHRPRV